MANLILTNNSSQVECTLSQHYCRLTGSFAGPLTASSAANSGFLIQNGNKQSGLFVGNTCVTFYNNCLDFDPANTDVNFNIPSARNFIITGNNSLLTFNADGTLAVGAAVDTNYKGIQVVNTNPIFLLKDTDALNQSGTQALSFFDSTSTLTTSFCNEPSSSINTGLSITDNATNIVYNKYFRLKNNASNGSANTLVASDNNLTLFSGNCLNRSFNFAVGGTGYFSCGLHSAGIINSSGLCIFSNNSYLSGNADNVAFNISNGKSNSSGSINFFNPFGGPHSYIISNQNSSNGCSEIDFYVTPNGSYSSTNRTQLALEIKGDKNINFYGCLSGQSGLYNYLQTNELRNSGSKTFLNTGSNGLHCFLLNDSANIYSYESLNNCIINHIWYSSGNKFAMCINRSGSIFVTGSIFSNSGICTSGFLCVNSQNLDSCIISRCAVISGTNIGSCNIFLCGSVLSLGSFENNSLNSAKFNSICTTGNVDSSISGLFRTCSAICSTGLICSLSSIESSSSGVFNQGLYASSISAQGGGCFGLALCVSGKNLTNVFCGPLDVKGAVCSENTPKAWGFFELNDGAVSNVTGYNFSNVGIRANSSTTACNFAYQINLQNAVSYPFSLQISVMPKASFCWCSTTSSSITPFGTTLSGVLPIFAIPICSGINTASTPQALTLNGNYCSLFFILLNSKGYVTTFADLVKTNHDANIMFTVHSKNI